MEMMLRCPAVAAATGKSRSGAYKDVADGLLTSAVHIGRRSVAWPASEVQAINAARIAGKSDAEIKELVKRLHEARKSTYADPVPSQHRDAQDLHALGAAA